MTARPLTIVASSFVAVLALLFAPTGARAECPYIPPWPTVTEFGRSAREIVVGTVVGGGGSTFLDFRVDRVLRGSGQVGEVRKLENLLPNWPSGSYTYLIADEGDVIALAFDALAPDRRSRLNAAAWIGGTPNHYHNEGGDAEVVTLAKVEAIAALPQTSTAPERAAGEPNVLIAASLVVAAVMASLIALRRRLRGAGAT